MADLQRIPFGGMSSLEADELVPITQSLIASDCYLDKGIIEPRNGYRVLTGTAITSTGTPQGLWRFRYDNTHAIEVAAVNGMLYQISDPSSETTTGTATTLGTIAGTSDLVSAAAVGQHLYIGSGSSTQVWQRVKYANSIYSLEALNDLPQCSKPTFSKILSSLTYYKAAGITTSVGGGTGTNVSYTQTGLGASWSAIMGTDPEHTDGPGDGGYVQFTLPDTVGVGTGQDWSGYLWIACMVAPNSWRGTASSVDISITTQVGSSPGTFEKIGTTYDTPGASGSVSVIWCNLASISATVLKNVKYIRYTTVNDGNFFGVLGHICCADRQQLGNPQKYWVTLYENNTTQESRLSEVLDVNITDADSFVPSYLDCWIAYQVFRNGGMADPLASGNMRVFNSTASPAVAMPSKSAIGPQITITGSVPTVGVGSYSVRLWKQLVNGDVRLVESKYIASGDSYSIIDTATPRIAANQSYKAGGTPSACTAMTARGGRLIFSNLNRIYVSSFFAPSTSTDPFPIFPDISLEEEDGWSWDVSPSTAESVIWMGNGDVLYILTNDNAFAMTDVTPNSTPYHIFNRGCIGRSAATYCENSLFYAAYDGLYMISNRSSVKELTEPIRRMYRDWLNPDSNTVITYQSRKLYCICGIKCLRYDFVTGTWTRHTLSHTIKFAGRHTNPSDTTEHMWLFDSDRNIYRWQPSYAVGTGSTTTDAGTIPPHWVYTSGYQMFPSKANIEKFLSEAVGTGCTLSVYAGGETRTLTLENDLSDKPFAADLKGYRFQFNLTGDTNTTVKQVQWALRGVSGEGK